MSERTVEDLDEIGQVLNHLHVTYPELVGKALYMILNDVVMAKSITLVPVKTSYLQSTGTVELPTYAEGRLDIELGYGTNYAVFVHENLNAQHPNGQAKYLEEPMNEYADRIPDMVLERMERIMEAG